MLQKSTTPKDAPKDAPKGSKVQKRFHELLERIQLLKKQIQEKKELRSKAEQIRNQQLFPLLNQLIEVKLSQIRALDWAYDRKSFAKRLKRVLREEIIIRINELFQTFPLEEAQEKELTAILARHGNTSEEDIEQTLQRNREDEAREYLQFHYGIELDENEPLDLNDPEVLENIRAKIVEENNRHKKNELDDRHLLKAEKLQDKLNKSIRSVYTSLVKLLHPDKETDESKKIFNTEAIKEVTKAYQEKDMLALLILQSNYGIMEESIDESELRTYNTILQKQVNQLKMEYDTVTHSENGIPLSSVSVMEFFFNSEKSNLKKQLKHEQRLLRDVFEEEDMLIQYLKGGY